MISSGNRRDAGMHRLATVLNKFSRARVLVIGDLMLDRFIWGEVERISPEAPVPVVRVVSENIRPGGAANVVHNIRTLSGRVTACGVVGRDDGGKALLRELKRIGSSTAGVFFSAGFQTTQKSRVMARPRHQQIVRLDHENAAEIDGAVLRALRRFVERHARKHDAIVLSDYGKGVIHPELLELVQSLTRERKLPCIVDPKKENFRRYRDVTLVTPNREEAGQAAGIEIRDEPSLIAAGARLLDLWRSEAVLITLGQDGMRLFRRDGRNGHFPTAAKEVFDVTGAGDTVVATCALALASGATFEDAAVLANVAAGVVVGEVGTAAVSLDQLRNTLGGASARAPRKLS